jgi:hypothetical protein
LAKGDYTLTLLPPGSYNLAVEAPGFRKMTQNGVILEVNQRARIDFTMQVGQLSETIDVVASTPLLDSQSSSLGRVIPGDFVNELPLNGRNFVALAISTPGVNGTGFSTGGTIMSGTRPDDRRPGSELFSNGGEGLWRRAEHFNRNGNLYLQIDLRDRSGSINARMWNAGEHIFRSFDEGDFLHVQGKVQLFQGALQMILNHLDKVPPTKFMSPPPDLARPL